MRTADDLRITYRYDYNRNALRASVISGNAIVALTDAGTLLRFDSESMEINVYWEGLCSVAGTHGGQAVAGYAYVELANYPHESGVGSGWAAHSITGDRSPKLRGARHKGLPSRAGIGSVD